MQDPLASWATILGTIATFIIALLTFFSVRVARDSLKLMEQRENRLRPSLHLFHNKSYMKLDKGKNSRVYAVHVSVTCNSDTDNSVKDLSMRIYFKRDSKITSNVAIPTMRNVEKYDISLVDVESNTVLVVPFRIRAHEAVTGWGIFKVSNELLDSSEIDNYQVTITDAQNVESFLKLR